MTTASLASALLTPAQSALLSAKHWPACSYSHKLKYTRKQAHHIAGRIRQKGSTGVVYHCRDCGWHHVASEQRPASPVIGRSPRRNKVPVFQAEAEWFSGEDREDQ